MMPYTRLTRPATDRTAPGASTRGLDGSLELGTIRYPARRAVRTTGTLTRKTDPHQKWSRRIPPTTGPKAIPSPDTPAHTPMARPRSSAGNTLVRIDSVDGMISAPPTPIRARVAVRRLAVPAKAEATEPAPKITRPHASAERRPNRSDRLPVVSRRP